MADHMSGKCSRALGTWNALQGVLQRVPSPTETPQPRKAADRRAIERSRDRLAKALDACSEAGLQRPQGGIARSLRLPNVLLALYRLLSALAHRYRDCGHLLIDNLYLRVFLRNVDSKSRELVRLLTHERGAVLEERSPARRQLTRLSLVLSHIATELSAFFPHGVYEGESVEIRERDAAAFWTHAFDDRVIVPWKEFLEQISQCHQLDSKHEVIALQESMDLTCSGWVSVYDFDIFTRLFQPWSFALQSWKALMLSHPGYMAFLTYDEVRTRLQKYQSKPGSYVFRLSCSRPGQWAIGYVAKDGRIVQAVPPPTMPLHEVLQDGAKQGLYLYPDGRCKNVDLSSLCQHTRSSTSSPDEPNRSPIPQICREYFFVPMADGEKLSPGRQGSTAVSDDLMSLFDPLSPSSLQPTNANELLTPPIPPRSPTSRYTPLVAAEHSTVDTEIERLLGKGFTYTAIARAFRVANGDPQLAETILKAYAQPSLSTMLSTCQP